MAGVLSTVVAVCIFGIKEGEGASSYPNITIDVTFCSLFHIIVIQLMNWREKNDQIANEMSWHHVNTSHSKQISDSLHSSTTSTAFKVVL